MDEPTAMVSKADRTLFIFGEISSTVSGQVIEELHRLEKTEGDINIILQSEGGEEVSGYAIYDAITMCKNRVIVTAYGEVSSIAAIIFQAGDWRRMTPNATTMAHNGSIGMNVTEEGYMNQDSVIELAEKLKKDNKRYYQILSRRSQKPIETIEEWCRTETEFSAEEAVNCGLADEMVLISKNVKKRSKKK